MASLIGVLLCPAAQGFTAAAPRSGQPRHQDAAGAARDVDAPPARRRAEPAQPRPTQGSAAPARPRPVLGSAAPARPRPTQGSAAPARPRPTQGSVAPAGPRPARRRVAPARPRLDPQEPRAAAPEPPTAVPEQGPKTPAPDFLDPGRRHMDSMVFGIDGGNGLGVYMEVATLYWRHVMLIPARAQGQFGILPFEGAFTMRVGTLVGFGGFHGLGQRFSHWFIIGSELIYAQAPILGRGGETTLVGWLIPVGYDFRHHFGEDFKRVWGVRAYLGVMPVFWKKYSDTTCKPLEFFCNQKAHRVKYPLVAGLCLFIGFQ